jgi:hypothetical protein
MSKRADAFIERLREEALIFPQGQAAFVLAHGRAFEAGPDAFEGRKMRMKLCFSNAQRLALWGDSLAYCEGYVWSQKFAIHHAWVLRADGSLREPTLRGEPKRYFGVAFARAYIARRIVAMRSFGCLLDHIPQLAADLSDALIRTQQSSTGEEA